jgi:hypothetical protein
MFTGYIFIFGIRYMKNRIMIPLKKIRIRSIIVGTFVFAACTGTADHDGRSDNQKAVDTISTSDTSLTGFGGDWINKKYAEKLRETQSPKASQNSVSMAMLILPSQINQQATIIWGLHEGSNGIVKKIKEAYGIYSDDGNMEHRIIFKNGRISTGKDEFIKIKGGEENSKNIAEQLIFAGKYDLSGKQVEFTYDGKVIGLDTSTYYNVLIDYIDAGMQVDQLRLGSGSESSGLYGFNFNKDTLRIYELNCLQREDDYCVVVENGKELFKMIKK